jgi:hypothetical protein
MLSKRVVAFMEIPPRRPIKIGEVQSALSPPALYNMVVKRRTALIIESFHILSDWILFSDAPFCHAFDEL